MYIIKSSIFPTKFFKEYLRKFFGKCEWCVIEASDIFVFVIPGKNAALNDFLLICYSA